MKKTATAEEVKKYVASKIKSYKTTEVYTLYECGCVFPLSKDPRKKRKIKGHQKRCCPVHWVRMVGMFRECPNCGKLYFRGALRPGKFCSDPACHRQYQKTRNRKIKKSQHKNQSLCDPSRFDCSLRQSCLKRYDRYETLPCKGCKDYQPGGLEKELAIQGARTTTDGFDLLANQF